MVKNTQGGSKHKSQARKRVNDLPSDNIRFPSEDGECFAVVSKMLGNGMCHVNFFYNDQMFSSVVCHIRGKFKSRNKKSNHVAIGSVVLIGLRSWSSNINACDLLYVYPDNHINSLNIHHSLISSSHPSLSNDDPFVFSHSTPHKDTLDSNFHNHIDYDNHQDNDNDIDFDAI